MISSHPQVCSGPILYPVHDSVYAKLAMVDTFLLHPASFLFDSSVAIYSSTVIVCTVYIPEIMARLLFMAEVTGFFLCVRASDCFAARNNLHTIFLKDWNQDSIKGITRR